ncbi:patatin-like phospholipase family protein [bacterium]|nr:patatin-like phospholipase family protein [bacterium]
MNKGLKYTCLFGGGAVRGMSYIGTVNAFENLGIKYDTLGGSSVGSIFAALLAVGYTSDEMKDIFAQVNFNLFRDISLGIGPIFAFSKGEVFLDWIRDLIESKFYGEKYKKGYNKAVTFNDIQKNLVILTTDLGSFKCKEFSRFETPDYEIASAVRISCCMPGLMKPVEYNNTLLVDGDLQKSWPMWKLSDNLMKSNDRILELRLEGYYDDNNISGVDYANAVYSCMTASATAFVKELYGNKDRFDYIVLNTGDVVVVDFNISDEKRNELIKIGYEQTINYFKAELPEKKNIIKNCYECIQFHLLKIKKYIESSKPIKVKIELGDLYTDIVEYHNVIDERDIEIISNFKELFYKNIKYPALFGKAKIKDGTILLSELQKLIKHISDKLDELSLYMEYIDNL